MDALEIGRALAFPAVLLAGLQIVDEGFGLLDAAAAAAGDDPVLAADAFAVLGQGWAPAGGTGPEAGEDGDDEVKVGEVGAGAAALPLGARVSGAARMAGAALARAAGIWAGRGSEGSRSAAHGAGGRGVPRGVGAEPSGAAPVGDARRRGDGLPAAHGGRRGGRTGEAASVRRREGGIWGRDAPVRAERGVAGERAVPMPFAARMPGERGAAAYQRGTQARAAVGESAAPVWDQDGWQGDLPVTARVAAAERGWAMPRRGQGTEIEVARRAPEPVSAREDSAAPQVGGGGRGQVAGLPIGSLFSDRAAAAPAEDSGGGRAGGDRPVVLDGRVIGQWLSERMARDAARPGAGPSFFDPRQAPAWTPSGAM